MADRAENWLAHEGELPAKSQSGDADAQADTGARSLMDGPSDLDLVDIDVAQIVSPADAIADVGSATVEPVGLPDNAEPSETPPDAVEEAGGIEPLQNLDAMPRSADMGRHAKGAYTSLRRLGIGLAVLLAFVGAVVVLALVAWPKPLLGTSPAGLASVRLPAFAGTITSVSARTAQGEPVAVRLRSGVLEPLGIVRQGAIITIDFIVAPPAWAAWLIGRTRTSSVEITTPTARLSSQWITVSAGSTPRVRFVEPVRVVKLGDAPAQVFATPRREVSLSASSRGLRGAGVVDVCVAAQPWEALSSPTRVAWFPEDSHVEVLAEPAASAAGTMLSPDTTLTLTFSVPLLQVLGSSMPSLSPKTAGSWRTLDAHTIAFVPRDSGYVLGSAVRVRLPVRVRPAGRQSASLTQSLSWNVRPATTRRLQQLFAELGYLPLDWQPFGSAVASSVPAQYVAAVLPPEGRFAWKYPASTPRELRALWQPGVVDQITLGAIMTFEHEHHMPADEHAGRRVWAALIHDAIAGVRHIGGYNYVYVHSQVPTSLNLWHDGKVILTSPGNTGVPAAPTQLGTFRVFEHIPVGIMSGTNPSGSQYNDPGIRWISYFDHGAAIHAFNRASFGTPQSLGCVELPLAAAAKVWPYTPIGTLVTIEK